MSSVSLKSYLKPILSRKHSELKLADASAGAIDEHVGALVENLTSDAGTYASVAKRRTVMAKDVEMVVRMALKHETAGLATLTAAAASALEAYHAEAPSDPSKDVAKKSRSGRAQLVLPISRIEAHMRRVATPLRLSDDVGVFTTAIAEVAASDILDLAGSLTKEDGKKIVSPAHVQTALEKTAWKTLMTKPSPGVGDASQTAGNA
jgi:histone H3/H4